MKASYPTLLLLLAGTMAFAQKSTTVSIGGGRSFSSTALKQEALIGDGVQAGADVFVPFLQKSKFSLGVLAGASYQSAKHLSPELKSKYGDLQITNTSSNSQAFAFSAGLQADLILGRIILSPSFSGGYFTSTQDVSKQNTQVMVNGTTQNVVLSASPEVKTKGLIMIPQLKVGYCLTGNLSVYAAASVNVGPTATRTQHDLIPSGGFNDKNTYEPMQLADGRLALDGSSKEAKYITTSVQAGLSWTFGKARRVGTTKTKGGSGATSASYAAGRAVATSDTPRPARQTPNTSFGQRQTQGSNFGEKVGQGLHPAGSSIVASPGNPIGGIIVKGGKNPGGNLMTITTDSKGQFEFTAKEAGDYSFVLTAPQEKSDNLMQNARPGNPIGGIIVKGGKNPGGNMLTIITNSNGTIDLKGLTAGKYTFIVTSGK